MPSSLIQTRVRSTSLWFSLLRSSEFQFSRQLKADTTEVVERPYSSEISVVVIGGVWPPSNDRWLPIGVRVPRRLLSTCLHWTLIEKPDNAANKRSSSNNWTWLEDIQLHTHCWVLTAAWVRFSYRCCCCCATASSFHLLREMDRWKLFKRKWWVTSPRWQNSI